jgi:Fe2+ or Zn2+ uptake regulation protein
MNSTQRVREYGSFSEFPSSVKRCETRVEIVECLRSHAPEELTGKIILQTLFEKGIKCKPGTFYNYISDLQKQGKVVSRRSSLAYYRYVVEENEIHGMGDRNQSVISDQGFVNTVLELARANGFEAICRVHDVHLATSFWYAEAFAERVSSHPEVWYKENCFRWKPNKKAQSWNIQLFVGYHYRVSFQVFECGTLTAIIKCAGKPFPAKLEGLRNLEDVLNEACLIVFGQRRSWPFPPLDKWVITFWHYGRDSKRTFDCCFNVVFRDWFENLARIYIREEDGRLRIEEFQNPRKTLGLLKSETAKNQDGQPPNNTPPETIHEKISACQEDELRNFLSSPAVTSKISSIVESTVNKMLRKFRDGEKS